MSDTVPMNGNAVRGQKTTTEAPIPSLEALALRVDSRFRGNDNKGGFWGIFGAFKMQCFAMFLKSLQIVQQG